MISALPIFPGSPGSEIRRQLIPGVAPRASRVGTIPRARLAPAVAESEHSVDMVGKAAEAGVVACEQDGTAAGVAMRRTPVVEHFVPRGRDQQVAGGGDGGDLEGAQLLEVARGEFVALSAVKVLLH